MKLLYALLCLSATVTIVMALVMGKDPTNFYVIQWGSLIMWKLSE